MNNSVQISHFYVSGWGLNLTAHTCVNQPVQPRLTYLINASVKRSKNRNSLSKKQPWSSIFLICAPPAFFCIEAAANREIAALKKRISRARKGGRQGGKTATAAAAAAVSGKSDGRLDLNRAGLYDDKEAPETTTHAEVQQSGTPYGAGYVARVPAVVRVPAIACPLSCGLCCAGVFCFCYSSHVLRIVGIVLHSPLRCTFTRFGVGAHKNALRCYCYFADEIAWRNVVPTPC